MSNPFGQNIIACVWDFDKTLIPGYMQTPLFEDYGVREAKFLDEVNFKMLGGQSDISKISRFMSGMTSDHIKIHRLYFSLWF